MKLVIQKVSQSSVTVDGKICGRIDHGYMVLVGFSNEDTNTIVERMIDKLIGLRIFEDAEGKLNHSLLDVNGSILSISQFTLYANCKKGRRPSFIDAAKGEISKPLYDYFNTTLINKGIHVEQGIFGADMKVSLVNEGPVTIVLDSKELF